MNARRALLVGFLLLAACGRQGPLEALAAGETGRVAEVRNGETLVLGSGLVVRLAGFEAPNGREPYAAEAKAALTKLASGKEAKLYYGGLKRDRYGRALAHVRVGGTWLQGQLLRDGTGRVHTFADNRALAREMYEAEAAARVDRRGLWALATYQVRLPKEMAGKRGFQLVEGRVAAIEPRGERSLIRLAGGGPAVLVNRADLTAAGLAPETLNGKLVRVRGFVTRSGVFLVDHSEVVELLREP